MYSNVGFGYGTSGRGASVSKSCSDYGLGYTQYYEGYGTTPANRGAGWNFDASRVARAGDVTRGKRIGTNFIIRA